MGTLRAAEGTTVEWRGSTDGLAQVVVLGAEILAYHRRRRRLDLERAACVVEQDGGGIVSALVINRNSSSVRVGVGPRLC